MKVNFAHAVLCAPHQTPPALPSAPPTILRRRPGGTRDVNLRRTIFAARHDAPDRPLSENPVPIGASLAVVVFIALPTRRNTPCALQPPPLPVPPLHCISSLTRSERLSPSAPRQHCSLRLPFDSHSKRFWSARIVYLPFPKFKILNSLFLCSLPLLLLLCCLAYYTATYSFLLLFMPF